MTMQYEYNRAKDLDILTALVRVWNPPHWATAMQIRPPDTVARGNCIAASRFARHVLDLLHVECEVTVTRARGNSSLVGWGDCRLYMFSRTGLPGHAVVIGHDWLFDPAAELMGAPGPVIALPTDRSEWASEDGTYEYTWAPGLRYQAPDHVDFGSKAPARRIARDVRTLVGPCRAPRPFEWM